MPARLKIVREHVLRATTREVEDLVRGQGVEVSHVSVIRYEKGERVPGADYVAAIGSAAKVSLEWIMLGQGPRDAATTNGADPFFVGLAVMASRVIDAVQETMQNNAPANGRGDHGALFREAANRLRELGANHRSVRQPEESGSH